MNGDAGERDAWVALAATNGVGEVLFWALVQRHGGAAAVLDAVRRRRVRIPPGHPRARETLEALRRTAVDPGATARRLAELGVWTVTPLDDDHPSRLRVLDPLPAVLYGWGERRVLHAPRSVAVVGTRRPTLTGRALAARLGSQLAAAGAVVVSGLAVGIDGAAHAASVDAGGATVGVIGGGHGEPGPRAHRSLVAAILSAGGVVLSEYPPDDRPTPGTFPRRNRIISALADATVVVEAPRRSGALITARHALDQGRPVYAAPGRPGDPAVAGCLALLRETPSRPLVGPDELIADLGYDRPSHGDRRDQATPPTRPLSVQGALDLLGPTERAVAARLARGPADPDALVSATGLAPPVVSGALTLLLLRGWARAVGAGYLAAGPLLGEAGGS